MYTPHTIRVTLKKFDRVNVESQSEPIQLENYIFMKLYYYKGVRLFILPIIKFELKNNSI